MSDDTKQMNGTTPPVTPPVKVDPRILAMQAIGSQVNLLIAFGVSTPDAINALMDVVGNMVAGVEPAEVRQSLSDQIRQNFPGIVDRHYQIRHTRPSGLIVPR